MPSTIAALQTALRVLTALTEKREADAADVEELHRLVPGRTDLPLDELACEVIQVAIRTRTAARDPKE